MQYKEQLETIASNMKRQRDLLTAELDELPEGMLFIESKNGTYYYSQRIPKGGNHKKEHRFSINNDNDMIFSLTRKKYISVALPALEKNISKIETLADKLVLTDEESVMREFISKYPQLANGIYRADDDLNEWQRDFTPIEGYFEEDLKSVTGKGMKTRSVGELYIASCLDKLGIPYRYEAPLGIPDLSYLPDFTIIRPRDRKLFYWEHFGLTDSDEYIKNALAKGRDYIQYGIVPWDNLIMTYNFADGGLNAKLIDSMIDAWLL